MTTRNFDMAMLLPAGDPPLTGGMVVFYPGDPFTTIWADPGTGGGGGTLPVATAEGQIIVSGPGPAYAWTVDGDADGGDYS